LGDGSQLYVALRRRDQVRSESYVACFDAQQGRLLWRQFLCATETRSGQRSPEPTHNLLTLDEDTLYYNTNQGVVAALRAGTGEIRWLTTYPRTPRGSSLGGEGGGHRFRHLTPCMVHRDLVLVAAADCQRIFALDAMTGHPLWMTVEGEATGAVHLLGVGEDRVLASGDSLYWLDLYTGRLVGQFPSPRFAASGHARVAPRGAGRGILAGRHVYWPTRDAVYVLRQQTERTPRGWEPVLDRVIPLHPGGASGGNLLLAEGVLLIAAADRLYAFNETGTQDHAQRGRRTGGGEARRGVPPDHE
jgi:outer membrane protein assembly factor BamB